MPSQPLMERPGILVVGNGRQIHSSLLFELSYVYSWLLNGRQVNWKSRAKNIGQIYKKINDRMLHKMTTTQRQQ